MLSCISLHVCVKARREDSEVSGSAVNVCGVVFVAALLKVLNNLVINAGCERTMKQRCVDTIFHEGLTVPWSLVNVKSTN